MKIEMMTKYLLAAGLALGLGTVWPGAGDAHAQTVGQDIKDAGHATKEAAVDTGHATKKVARKTAHGTKVGAQKTAHGTKRVAKTTARRTANAGDALAGKPEQH